MDAVGVIRRRASRTARRSPAFLTSAIAGLALAAALAAPGSASAASTWHEHADWEHMDLVVQYLQAHTPQRPVVYLLGGSAARECTISDRNWRRQIVNMGGPSVLAFNLGASSEAYTHNIDLVRQLPAVPSLVLIGVNVGRYTHKPPAPYAGAGVAAEAPTLKQVDDYYQHRFSGTHTLTYSQKSALLTKWLRERYPLFQDRFPYNADRLKDLVAVCQERGFGVVLFNLPLDLHVIKHRLDRPRARYRRNCESVAETYKVPWVDFVAKIGLVSSDFVDNWHLIQPGRVKWQKRVTRMTIAWLKQYKIGQATSAPTPAPTPTVTTSSSPS